MTPAFTRSLKFISRWEGGWVNDPADPGGPTMAGVTWQTYQRWKARRGEILSNADAKAQVRYITPEEIRMVYLELYWEESRCDWIEQQGFSGMALLVFDASVNQGPGRAGKFLQRAMNSNGAALKVDGAIGPNTLAKLKAANDHRALLRDFTAYRLAHYTSLVHLFIKYGFGWRRRAIDAALEADRMDWRDT